MTAYAVRMMRENLIEVLDSDYVRMARLKGLPRRKVLLRHALPNALGPAINVTALNIAWLIGGIVVVESVFNFPGLGRLLVASIAIKDVPVILAAMPGRIRARVAPAMAKEFFKAHFFPRDHTWMQWFTNSLNYYLAAFYFNAFPLPQRETGARQTLRYIGDLTSAGYSVLIFPEGERRTTGAIKPFRGGIGMIGARLDVPIVPVRLDGVDRILPTGSSFIRPGRVRVAFGAPLRLRGDDYAALAKQVEDAVRGL